MFNTLPDKIHLFMQWNWEQILPYVENLEERTPDEAALDQWLLDWSKLNGLITESFRRLEIRTTTHTNDRENLERYARYSEEIMPAFRSFENRMKQKLLHADLEPENFAIPMRKLRSEAALFREANLALMTKIEQLGTEYSKVIGARSFNWDGEELTIPQVTAKLTESERAVRERAWRALSAIALEDQQEIDPIWRELLDLRQQLAENAGYTDFRAYRWEELGRLDYIPQDCKSFHQVIEEFVVPATGRMSERRSERMGLDSIRPWDDYWFRKPDPSNRSPLRPFETVEQLNDVIERVFQSVDPEFGTYYRIMRDEGYLDLESRKHKASNAYMEELPFSGRPFIFANAVGSHSNVITQLHEGGHAFHFFEASHWPYYQQASMDYMPVEFIEVGSMAMELLAAPYLNVEHGGFYSKEDAKRARVELLEGMLAFWPYMAVVDAFQHWVYENPELAKDPKTCDDRWEQLHRRYLPQYDWSGVEDSLRVFWRSQGHIITAPFYYIEYGLAQLGAAQIWSNALKDQAKAVQKYRNALQLGATASLPDLFQTAGAEFSFDASVLPKMVRLIEETIYELEAP